MVTFCVRVAWVLFVNTMSLLSWLATHKPKSCTLPTQSAHDDNLEGTGGHLQIDNPAAGSVVDRTVPLLDKAQSINQAESSDAISMTVPVSLEPNNPHQPILRPFPKRTFGKQQRSFCSSWYDKHKWLHYEESTDKVFCYYCMVAEKRRLPMDGNRDDAFSTEGFFNWKKGLERFERHESTAAHREAVEMLVCKTRDVER